MSQYGLALDILWGTAFCNPETHPGQLNKWEADEFLVDAVERSGRTLGKEPRPQTNRKVDRRESLFPNPSGYPIVIKWG